MKEVVEGVSEEGGRDGGGRGDGGETLGGKSEDCRTGLKGKRCPL